ncbi:MAG: T9SS type A sorting domain-containing protein [Bacteroidales bacterium]|nr:T9SS type A sorting domain-containing protein [Bacteroidales bacterium]
MKKLFIFFIMAYSTITISFAQNTFYKSFNIYDLQDVIKTYDNGFACVSMNGGILKIDSTNQFEFYKELSCDSTMFFSKIIQTTDSGFVIETQYDPFHNSGLGSVVKFDKSGNYLWTKQYYYPTITSNSIWDIFSSENNGFYLVGTGCIGGPILIKCDKTGDIIWQKKSNYTPSILFKTIKYSDDKFLIFGMKVINNYLTKIIIYLVDTSGNFIWLKEFDNNGVNWTCADIIKTTNNEYSILISTQDSTTHVSNTANNTIHIDSSGNILWAKKLLTNEPIQSNQMRSFTETSDKGYLYTGQLGLASGSKTVYLKTDSLNNVEWTRYFDDFYHINLRTSIGVKVFNKNKNCYVFSKNSDGLSIAKLDENGHGLCDFDTIHFITENILYNVTEIPASSYTIGFLSENVKLNFNDSVINSVIYCFNNDVNKNEMCNIYDYYPNPTTGKLTIKIKSNVLQNYFISIKNIQGQEVLLKNVEFSDTYQLDLTDIANGIYFLMLQNDKVNYVSKIMKQ